MNLDALTCPSLNDEDDGLTQIHAESGIPIPHLSRHTEGGFLVTRPRLVDFVPTPIDYKQPLSYWVWKQGHPVSRKDATGEPVKYWLCHDCYHKEPAMRESKWLFYAAPTTTPIRHLVKHHHFNKNGTKTTDVVAGIKRPHSDLRTLWDQEQQANKRVFDRDGWEDAYTSWVAASGTSLRMATHKSFIRLLSFQHPRVKHVVPTSHNTMATWLIKSYTKHQATVVTSLAKATSGITISFDGWKANNDVLDLLGVMAHYLDEHYKHRTVLLGLRDTHGSHTGTNIGDHLFDVLGDYKIRSKVSFFAADNATNNDTALKHFSNRVTLDPVKQRLRCAGHVLNLVCKAILYGVDEDCVIETLLSLQDGSHTFTAVSAFEETINTADKQAKLRAWRKKGPIGKLHNLVLHIKDNSSRRELFEAKQREADTQATQAIYRAVINGGIRWNSAYLMIHRAMKLRDALTLYQDHYQGSSSGAIAPEDLLTYDDWTELTHLQELLEPIYECSLNVQSAGDDGCHGALHEVLTTMDFLLEHLEGAKQRLNDPKIVTHFKATVNLGWKTLDHYYMLTDRAPE